MPDQQSPDDPWGYRPEADPTQPAGQGQAGQSAAGNAAWQSPSDQGLFGDQGSGAGTPTEQLDPTSVVPPTPKGVPTTLIAGGAAAAVLLVGGGVYAYSLTGSDSVKSLDCLVPASAAFYLQVDANPSSSQQSAAMDFARKFAALEAPSGDTDMRSWLFDSIQKSKGSDAESKTNWGKVEKWAGNSMALAVMPGGSNSATAVPMMAIEVKDKKAAESFLKEQMADDTSTKSTFAIDNDWAYVLPGEDSGTDVQAVLGEAKKSSLLDSKTYTEDMKALGEKGLFTGWVDLGKVATFSDQLDAAAGKAAGGVDPSQVKNLLGTDVLGHGAYAVRFDGKGIELISTMHDVKPTLELEGTAGVSRLPGDTLAAMSMGGMGKMFAAQWELLISQQLGAANSTQMLKQMEQQYGLSLPDDLEALLGNSFTIAVGGGGSAQAPQMGVRVDSEASALDKPLKAISTLLTKSGLPMQYVKTGKGYTLGTTSDYAKKLGTDGNLGSTDRFKKAVPDADGADSVVYLDVSGLVGKFGSTLGAGAPIPAELSAIDAFGMSQKSDKNGEVNMRMRLTMR